MKTSLLGLAFIDPSVDTARDPDRAYSVMMDTLTHAMIVRYLVEQTATIKSCCSFSYFFSH